MKDAYQRFLDAMSDEAWAEYQAGQPDDEDAMNAAYPPTPPTPEELDDMARRFGLDTFPF